MKWEPFYRKWEGNFENVRAIFRIKLNQGHNFYSVKVILNENLTYLNFIRKTS